MRYLIVILILVGCNKKQSAHKEQRSVLYQPNAAENPFLPIAISGNVTIQGVALSDTLIKWDSSAYVIQMGDNWQCAVAHFDSVGRVYSCNYRGKRFYDDTTVRYTVKQWDSVSRNRFSGVLLGDTLWLRNRYIPLRGKLKLSDSTNQ